MHERCIAIKTADGTMETFITHPEEHGDDALEVRVVLCSGNRRVDTTKLATVCAAHQVRQASAECTRSVTGYSIGGVPPVAHATTLPIFMDQELLTCEVVYAAAGTARTLFAIAPQTLRDASGARVVSVSTA